MAEKTVDTYQLESEREYLQQNVLTVQLGENIGDESSEKLGAELNPKNLDHTADWHIVEVDGKDYGNEENGEGWNFVEKETTLPGYGKAQHSWLVNYETGEIIELEEDGYTDVSAGDMVYVKDDLIINIDSSLVDNIDNSLSNEEKKKALEKQLGGEKGNVELENFDFNGDSGLTSTSFNFDGVNDYIKVKYDKEEEKQKFLNRGFTFEFYGKWNGGTTDPKWLETEPSANYNGLFCFWNGNENQQALFRFRYMAE